MKLGTVVSVWRQLLAKMATRSPFQVLLTEANRGATVVSPEQRGVTQ